MNITNNTSDYEDYQSYYQYDYQLIYEVVNMVKELVDIWMNRVYNTAIAGMVTSSLGVVINLTVFLLILR
jgi:hypothetical protein